MLLTAVLVVHRLGPILGDPFWLDEAWVALSTTMPIGDLPWATSSTPLGWTFLIWLLPAHGQVLRVVPWVFLVGSIFGGYAFGRFLPWPSRAWAVLAGLAGAVGALLLPAQVLRHDLKQYTADAAIAVLLLVLLSRLEAAYSRRRLIVLGAAVVVGMLFSHTTALVGAAVLVAVVVLRRGQAIVFVGAVGAGMALVYIVVDGAARNGSLNNYWAPYFPSVGDLPHYLGQRLGELRMYLGVPWLLFVLLALAGVAAVARYGRPATALALGLLPLIEVAGGLGHLYPLLDLRTSHFLLVTGAIAGGIGVVGALSWLAVALPGRWVVAAAAAVALAAFTAFALVNWHVVSDPGPIGRQEDARAQAAYIAAHRRPGDVILVSSSGSFAFAYYWHLDRPRIVRGGRLGIGWYVAYPPQDRIVISPGPAPDAVASAFTAARNLAGNATLWIVRSHTDQNDEARSWNVALAGQPVITVPVGSEPLLRLGGASSS